MCPLSGVVGLELCAVPVMWPRTAGVRAFKQADFRQFFERFVDVLFTPSEPKGDDVRGREGTAVLAGQAHHPHPDPEETVGKFGYFQIIDGVHVEAKPWQPFALHWAPTWESGIAAKWPSATAIGPPTECWIVSTRTPC